MRIATNPNCPTALEVIDLSYRLLEMSGKLDTQASNLVYKTTTVLMVGHTMLRSYAHGRLEVRRRNGGPGSKGIVCYSLSLLACNRKPEHYDLDVIDTLVVQLRRVLILESLANI